MTKPADDEQLPKYGWMSVPPAKRKEINDFFRPAAPEVIATMEALEEQWLEDWKAGRRHGR